MFTYEKIPEGYRVYKDKVFLVAIFSTKHHPGGTDKTGAVLWEVLPPEQWSLHFTSPQISVADVKAIISTLPTEA